MRGRLLLSLPILQMSPADRSASVRVSRLSSEAFSLYGFLRKPMKHTRPRIRSLLS